MIESPAIKRFIILYFLENPTDTVFDMVRSIYSYLNTNFVADEVVFVKSRGTHAKVQGSKGDTYILKTLVEHDLDTVEASSEDILRKDHLSKSCILKFLEDITKDSPFGRVLRKNILHDMSICSKEKISNLRVSKREHSRDVLFSRYQDEKCAEDYYVHLEPSKNSETDTDYNVKEEEAGGSSDLDTKLASRSEETTPVNSTSYEKSKAVLQTETKVSFSENNECSCTSHSKVVGLYLKNNFSSIGSALDLLNCESVEIKGICDMELFMEVYLLFSHFRKYFNIVFSKEDFAEALLDRSYSSEIAFRIHKALLDVLSREAKAVGRSQFKQVVECAVDICVPENRAFASKPLQEKYDWSDTDINEHNWRDTMESFFSQIYHIYGLHCIVFYKEFTTGCADDIPADRLGIIKFLMECMFCTNTFRHVVNIRVKEARQRDRNRHEVAKLKKARESTSDTESLDRAVDGDVSSLEKSLSSVERKMLSNGYRADIVHIDGVQFVYFEGRICFWRDRKFYMMSAEQMRYLLKAYMPQCRHYNPFNVLLKNYFFSFPGNTSNASEIFLSDRESM